MAKETKTELAVIDFTKFSVAQLPELKGKKEEIASIIKANPIVEIVDNATYESAKKSRTAVKTLRTGLQKEQTDVRKRIKEHVLDVVDKEYDTLVLDVKSEEKSRQEPIDVWEEKKEEERKEKVRLEELRVKQIKDAVQTFKDAWIDNVHHLLFEGIDGFNELFEKFSTDFDRSKLAEFEVLFDDALLVIRQFADSKIKTLTEQEQIRIENLLIDEKNAEGKAIRNWQNEWDSNINSLVFSDILEIKESFKNSKLANFKHHISEYEEIYTSTEKRLHSQIELISKAEEQRIAQEKFLKEKKEFEEKQLEAKFQERKKFLVDEDYYRIYFVGECNEEEDVFKSKLLAFSDSEFEDFKLAVLKAKEPIVETTQEVEFEERVFESEPIASNIQNIVGNRIIQADYHEDDVHEVAVSKPHEFADFKEEQEYIEQATTKNEITWDSIFEEYTDTLNNLSEMENSSDFDFKFWLSEKYNVPTKKQ